MNGSGAGNVKLQKTLKRFNAKIADGSYYEALLTLQTIVNRYIPSKNYGDAIELLYHASLTLLEHKQVSSAYDTIMRIIEIFKLQDADPAEYKSSQLPKLLQLLNKYPNDDPTLPALSKETITYSISKSPYKLGDPALNYLFGQKFLAGGNPDNYQLAENFLVLSGHNNSNALDLYVDFLVQLYAADKSVDPSGLVGRLVVNYLYVGNIKFAQDGLDQFLSKAGLVPESKHKDLQLYGAEHKLLVFFQLFLHMIRKSNEEIAPAYRALINKYRDDLARAGLLEQVDFIGGSYFNVTVLQKQNNMMANLLSGFLGGSGK